MVHPKRLKKTKLEDVIAIITLSLFLAEVINILHRKINERNEKKKRKMSM